MLSSNEFVTQSLELHLFFVRIMKEHAFFLATAFTPKDSELMQKSKEFQKKFNNLLEKVIVLSDGIIGADVLKSGEILTPFTLRAEMLSSYFTGVNIDIDLTQAERGLTPAVGIEKCTPMLEEKISILNNNTMCLLKDFIDFKTSVLSDVLKCNIFTRNYPSLLEHVIEEAKLYLSAIQGLQNREEVLIIQQAYAQEEFWNHIMEDHTKFIIGLLDPSEEKLIEGAEYFKKEFEELTRQVANSMESLMQIVQLTDESIIATEGIQDFKQQATQGLLECKIQSVIIPLLADHVLREANHYLRLLKLFKIYINKSVV